jgi:hypothetical protein
MKKFSERGRRILRKIWQLLSVGAVGLVFQACYGTPQDFGNTVSIRGTVKSKSQQTPIPGIQISIDDVPQYEKTGGDGTFRIWVPLEDSYTIRFEDIDGEDNGGTFIPREETIGAITNEIALGDIELELELDAE